MTVIYSVYTVVKDKLKKDEFHESLNQNSGNTFTQFQLEHM